MEKKREYFCADIEIVLFDVKDVIATSGWGETKEDESGWTIISDWS